MNKILSAAISSLLERSNREISSAERALEENNMPAWQVHMVTAAVCGAIADSYMAARDAAK